MRGWWDEPGGRGATVTWREVGLVGLAAALLALVALGCAHDTVPAMSPLVCRHEAAAFVKTVAPERLDQTNEWFTPHAARRLIGSFVVAGDRCWVWWETRWPDLSVGYALDDVVSGHDVLRVSVPPVLTDRLRPTCEYEGRLTPCAIAKQQLVARDPPLNELDWPFWAQ
jgi:hypothetical protein